MIEAIEQSAFATWIRESPSIWAYTLMLSLHAIGLATVVGLNAAVALRVLGIAPEIPLAPARKFFVLMYAGFWINALSGLALLMANASSLLTNAAFLVKLGFVALAVVNLHLLRRYVFDDDGLPVSNSVPLPGKTLALASLVLWSGAIVAGRLTAYPNLLSLTFG